MQAPSKLANLISLCVVDLSFQILHAYHLLEYILGEFIQRSANFDVVFWKRL